MILRYLTLFDAMSFWKSLQGFGHLASCGETVVQKGVFAESVSSLPP